ncbi:MAG: hypothetical protein ABII01_07730 [Candidatus Woesearchaeota archaeon]
MTEKQTRREALGTIGRGLGLGGLAAIVGGCITQSHTERDMKQVLSGAKRNVNADAPYSIVDGILYVAMPLLIRVTKELGVEIPFFAYPGLSIDQTVEIRWSGDSAPSLIRIAQDGTVDNPYGAESPIIAGLSRSEADKVLTELARKSTGDPNASVEFNSADSGNALSASSSYFHGAFTYHELRDGKLFTGGQAFTGTPWVLGKMLNIKSLGENAKYVAVSIPTGNGDDIVQTVAIADAYKSRSMDPRHNICLGNNYVVVPLGRNRWNETRRMLQQVAGLGSDVRGITGAVGGVLSDLQFIDENYDTLVNGDHVSQEPIDQLIEGTGKLEHLGQNVDALRVRGEAAAERGAGRLQAISQYLQPAPTK